MAGVAGDVLVTAGLVLLLFVAWQLWWTDLEANRAQTGTVQALTDDFAAGGQTNTSPGPPESVTPDRVSFGKAFAILRVPRLGAHYAKPVFEGTDRETLQKGVGHYVGTAQTGAVGNMALAGHRTTYGRPFHEIDRLERGDNVVVETRTGYAVYAVQRHAIVSPSAVEVLAPVPERPGAKAAEGWLTLTACHPKYSAAERYVVFAKLVRTYPRAEGLPAGTLDVPGKADG
jgi:sortase A